jgi:hypothetical protein
VEGLTLEQVPYDKLPHQERVYCNICATSIPALHRWAGGLGGGGLGRRMWAGSWEE